MSPGPGDIYIRVEANLKIKAAIVNWKLVGQSTTTTWEQNNSHGNTSTKRRPAWTATETRRRNDVRFKQPRKHVDETTSGFFNQLLETESFRASCINDSCKSREGGATTPESRYAEWPIIINNQSWHATAGIFHWRNRPKIAFYTTIPRFREIMCHRLCLSKRGNSNADVNSHGRTDSIKQGLLIRLHSNKIVEILKILNITVSSKECMLYHILHNVIQLSSWTVSLVTFVKTEIVRQCLWIILHGQHFLSILLSWPNKFSRIWKFYRYYIYFHQKPRWIAICKQWNRFQGDVEATGVESGSLGWWGWNDEITHSLT